jgi:8-oxo-dGTP diphosphatase
MSAAVAEQQQQQQAPRQAPPQQPQQRQPRVGVGVIVEEFGGTGRVCVGKRCVCVWMCVSLAAVATAFFAFFDRETSKISGPACLKQRLNSLGHGEWALPGGHLEFGESWESCAVREVAEETGIVLERAAFAGVQNVVHAAPSHPGDGGSGGGASSHYVVIFMRGTAPQGAVPRVLEPHKCAGWQWAEWDAIPRPMFKSLEQFQQSGGWRPASV